MNLSLRSNVFIFFIFLIASVSASFNTFRHFDFSYSVDTKSYVKMANGDFNVTVTHKYRFVAPILAGSIKKIFHLKSDTENQFWGDRVAFFIVNSILISLMCLILLHFLKMFGLSTFSAFLSVISLSLSRWFQYIDGLPLVDSLFLLAIIMLLYGVYKPNLYLLFASILIGFLAKESFLLFLPILFISKSPYKLWLLAWIVAVGALVFYVRTYINLHFPYSPSKLDALDNILDHIHNIVYSIKLILSIKGFFDLFFVFPLFVPIMLLMVWHRSLVNILKSIDYTIYFILFSVFVHVLLSGDIARMAFLAFPLVALLTGKAIDFIVSKYNFSL